MMNLSNVLSYSWSWECTSTRSRGPTNDGVTVAGHIFHDPASRDRGTSNSKRRSLPCSSPLQAMLRSKRLLLGIRSHTCSKSYERSVMLRKTGSLDEYVLRCGCLSKLRAIRTLSHTGEFHSLHICTGLCLLLAMHGSRPVNSLSLAPKFRCCSKLVNTLMSTSIENDL